MKPSAASLGQRSRLFASITNAPPEWNRFATFCHCSLLSLNDISVNYRHVHDSIIDFIFIFVFVFVLKVLNATDSIVLNAVDLAINKATVRLACDREAALESSEITFCAEQETATLKFPKVLAAGSDGVLHLEFVGNLNDKMKGFYRSKYFTPSGEERYGGVTQL